MILKHEDRINMTNNLISEQDKEKIYSLVLKYVKKYPKNLTNSMKMKQKKLSEEEFKKYIIRNLEKNLDQTCLPTKPTTVPDTLTSELLERVWKHEKSEREKIKNHYIHQKQAEMKTGILLEHYIQKNGLKFGWLASGTVIQHVDFLIWKDDGFRLPVETGGSDSIVDDDEFILYQIKNSDNTENAASKEVRIGTLIRKWHRRHSKKSENYFWNAFPDPRLNLSEEGFREFIDDFYNNLGY